MTFQSAHTRRCLEKITAGPPLRETPSRGRPREERCPESAVLLAWWALLRALPTALQFQGDGSEVLSDPRKRATFSATLAHSWAWKADTVSHPSSTLEPGPAAPGTSLGRGVMWGWPGAACSQWRAVCSASQLGFAGVGFQSSCVSWPLALCLTQRA